VEFKQRFYEEYITGKSPRAILERLGIRSETLGESRIVNHSLEVDFMLEIEFFKLSLTRGTHQSIPWCASWNEVTSPIALPIIKPSTFVNSSLPVARIRFRGF